MVPSPPKFAALKCTFSPFHPNPSLSDIHSRSYFIMLISVIDIYAFQVVF